MPRQRLTRDFARTLRVPAMLGAVATMAVGLTLGLGFALPDAAMAAEARTVIKGVNLTMRAGPGEVGHVHPGYDTQSVAETSLRVQVLDAPGEGFAYQLDYRIVKRDGVPPGVLGEGGAEFFRRFDWREELEEPEPGPDGEPSGQTVLWFHEVDRAEVTVNRGALEAVAGRHPITWGAGRVWLPTDLFAAFSPLEIDTEYKPGVDGLFFTWYPTNLSHLTLAHVLSPRGAGGISGGEAFGDAAPSNESTILRLRMPFGEESELTLLGGALRGVPVAGGSMETDALGAGWRVEAAHYRPEGDVEPVTIAIAGTDFSTDGGAVLFAEIYYGSPGAARESELAAVRSAPEYLAGRMPQLSRDVLALGGTSEFGGLWSLTYLGFASSLETESGGRALSLLHQFVAGYSLADNAEAAASLMTGTGAGLDAGEPRSEFGYMPDTLYLSVKFVL